MPLPKGSWSAPRLYVAPEVLLGRSAGRRADIYALGVTLFELATGRSPFSGHTFISVALAILTEPPPPVTQMLPGGLGEIIARAMARETAQRYQRVHQVRRDLASLSADLTDLPTGVLRLPDARADGLPSTTATGPSSHPAWRRPTVIVAGTVLAILLAALIFLLFSGARAPAASPPVAEVPSLDAADDGHQG